MKITFIARYFPEDMKGGGEQHIYELWKRAKKDHEVALISGWKKDPKLLPQGTFPIRMSDNKFRNYLRFYLKTRKYLKRIKPDIIFSSCPEIPLLTKSVVLVPHFGHWLHLKQLSFTEKLQRYFYINKMKKYTKVLTSSETSKKDLESVGIKVDNICYPGPSEEFKPGKKTSKKFVILCPSRISKEKGQHMLIRAIMELDPDILKNIEINIVGFVNDPQFLLYLQKASQGFPIKITTNANSMLEYYHNSDVVVFPTLMYEGFGMVAGEAAACGIPVIASDFSAIREVLSDNALYFAPGDTGQLAKHIATLYENKKLRLELGKKSRNFVLKKFNWEDRYNELNQIFQSLK